tara:strand:- start:810 stop:1025 length:216 start_codon:yes stop_codon:yes gene_type:complete
MDFKDLIDHYETLDKKDLIEKLVFKNATILNQDKVIEKLEDENKRLTEMESNHQKINGQLTEQIKQLKGEK